MPIFDFSEDDLLGRVVSVDTATVVVEVEDLERLQRMQVNRLVAVASDAGLHLLGLIQRITRKSNDRTEEDLEDIDDPSTTQSEQNLVRIGLIGTLFDKRGLEVNVFLRTLESVPRINAACYPLEGLRLTSFMSVVAAGSVDGSQKPLSIGSYSLDERAEAFLQGDKFFQRHAAIIGSTGSGKSCATARLLEQVAALPNANGIVFDIHGEYGTLKDENFAHYRIAGPSDLNFRGGVIFLPYWLLSYEAMIPLFIDRNDNNAPNQTSIMSEYIREGKLEFLKNSDHRYLMDLFTIASPIPFNLNAVLDRLCDADKEMVPGARSEKMGPYHGKLTRMIGRLQSKMHDRRLGFMFGGGEEVRSLSYLDELAKCLLEGSVAHKGEGGVKIIDFSEVPSDVLPLMISLVARMVFSIQQWTDKSKRHPIALFCDEAHNYIPDRSAADSADEISIKVFEQIAKEGRKFGVGLVIISQRPAEVSRTVLSQCNNMIAMRLTNPEDQSRIKALLPDSLGGFGDLLPILDIGEAIVVGDACPLPSRIRIKMPRNEPLSTTLPFWRLWSGNVASNSTKIAVENWRRQSLLRN